MSFLRLTPEERASSQMSLESPTYSGPSTENKTATATATTNEAIPPDASTVPPANKPIDGDNGATEEEHEQPSPSHGCEKCTGAKSCMCSFIEQCRQHPNIMDKEVEMLERVRDTALENDQLMTERDAVLVKIEALKAKWKDLVAVEKELDAVKDEMGKAYDDLDFVDNEIHELLYGDRWGRQ